MCRDDRARVPPVEKNRAEAFPLLLAAKSDDPASFKALWELKGVWHDAHLRLVAQFVMEIGFVKGVAILFGADAG